jgi:Fur family peroxide stress response transcriptional regulator
MNKYVKYKIVMNTKFDKTKLILSDKGIKPTFIRLKILEFLLNKRNHPTADMVYEELLMEIPTLSKMSVYNTLNMFTDNGLTLPLSITGIETRFDVDTAPHECKYFKEGTIQGNKIKELHGCFKGICGQCLEKERMEDN